MGFKLEPTSETSCIFKAVPEGDDAKEFLLCVQGALKKLLLDVRIDVSESPRSLGAILPELLKLQAVLKHHQKHVILQGIPVTGSVDFLKHLEVLGIEIASNPIHDPPEPEVAQSVILTPIVGSGPEIKTRLPDVATVEVSFKDLKDQLEAALSQKHRLEKEEQSYHARLQSFGIGASSVDQSKIKIISDLEAQVVDLKNQSNQLKKNLEEMEATRVGDSEKMKLALEEVRGEFRKKKDLIEKRISDTTKKRDALAAEKKKKAAQSEKGGS